MFKWLKGKKSELILAAPMTGDLLSMEEIPDQVFSAKMLGDGFAILPSSGKILSPCAGRITQIFPTSHALGIETPEGLEILIHIGIDTVEMKGEGFTRLVEAGESVEIGTPLLSIELDKLAAHGKSMVSPVIITNMERVDKIVPSSSKDMRAGITTAVRISLKE